MFLMNIDIEYSRQITIDIKPTAVKITLHKILNKKKTRSLFYI